MLGKTLSEVINKMNKKKVLLVAFIVEIIVLAVLGFGIVSQKSNIVSLSPGIQAWESRYSQYGDGWNISEGQLAGSEFDNGDIDLIYGPFIALDEGAYCYTVFYECTADQECYVHAYENDNFPDKVLKLKAGHNEASDRFNASERVDNFEIRVKYNGSGSLKITDIQITTSVHDAIMRFIICLVLFGIIDICIFFYDSILKGFRWFGDVCLKRPENSVSRRYDGLDVVKLVASLLIVFGHYPFPGRINTVIRAFCMVVVPFFFMIGGFFYNNIFLKGGAKKQIMHIVKLIIYSNVLYILWKWLFWKYSLVDLLKQAVTPKALVELFVFNKSPFIYHVWYLFALLYVLLIYYLFYKNKIENILIFFTPIALIAGLPLGTYAPICFGETIYHLYTRNFFFMGIPFTTMGIVLYRIKCKHPGKSKVAIPVLFYLSIAFLVCECLLLDCNNLLGDGQYYIGSILLTPIAVAYFADWKCSDSKVLMGMAKLGRKYSVVIYIIHVVVLDFIVRLYDKYYVGAWFMYLVPFIVFAISLVLAIVGDYLKGKAMQIWKNMRAAKEN